MFNFDSSPMDLMERLKDKTHYIVCLDFCTSCWGKREASNSEIIEIAAVLVDFRNQKTISTFHEYVRPTMRPKLSFHCTKLTGITQSFIDNQDPFPIIYRKLIDWLETIAKEHCIILITQKSEKWAFTFVEGTNNHTTLLTWGSWPLYDLFREECQRNSIKPPEYLKHWIDCRKHIATGANPFDGNLSDAMTRFGVEHTENEHQSAFDNVKKLAQLAMCLKTLNRLMNQPSAFANY